jgi:hypothetical protein
VSRLLAVAIVLALPLVATGGAGARRPAPLSVLGRLAPLNVRPASGGYVGTGWISTLSPRVAVVLLYPGSLLPGVQKRATTAGRTAHWIASSAGVTMIESPSLLPHGARPVAAYLFARGRRWWSLLAQTLLRGADVNRAELRGFCALGERRARDLVAGLCS